MQTRIKAVIFDAGGVLHKNNNAVVRDSLLQELQIQPALLGKIWASHIPLLGSGTMDEAEFWKQVSEQYGIRPVSVAENLLGTAYAAALTPYQEVLDLAGTLKKQGLALAVLSNTIEPHARAWQKPLQKYFDKLFLSYEVGLRKPDPAIYRYALRELGVKPGEALFIDDDPQNVAAAESLGMHGIVFTTPEELIARVQRLVPGPADAK